MIEIEERLILELPDVKLTVQLKAVIYFKNSNHYTLTYKNPRFKNLNFPGWYFYADRPNFLLNDNVSVKPYPAFSMNLEFASRGQGDEFN